MSCYSRVRVQSTGIMKRVHKHITIHNHPSHNSIKLLRSKELAQALVCGSSLLFMKLHDEENNRWTYNEMVCMCIS